MQTKNEFIYKVFTQTQWQRFTEQKIFAGSSDDLRDGFIHFSTWAQLAGTLSKHFAGLDQVVIAKICGVEIKDALRWESSRKGELFPHLYASLHYSAVMDHRVVQHAEPNGYSIRKF